MIEWRQASSGEGMGAQKRELLIQFKGVWEASQEGVAVEGKLEG